MYPEKADSAIKCAIKFRKLMKERPTFWAENVQDSIEHLTDSNEQIKWLKFMADPMGKTNNRHTTVPLTTDVSEESFHNHPQFEITRTIPGKMPTYHVNYIPPEKEPDDEKIPN